ncbi:MAG: alpha/beta fold hydrolase [Stagnimonas sp.]|nr:alpha/beta fold hydrolase [Stagnimonas sp.]
MKHDPQRDEVRDQARVWGSGLERQRRALADADMEVGHVEVRGVRLRYAMTPGTGEPLLFCNGIGANLELMLPLLKALEGQRVIVFDVPGAGGSEPATFCPSFSAYAQFAVGVVDALGHTGRFIVAGVSWGGGLAQQIAHDYPQRVSRMVLMATGAGFPMVPGRLSALLRMTTPQRYLSRTFMARNAAVLYGSELRGRPDFAIDYASLTRAPKTKTYLQQLAAISRFSSFPWLHRIRCAALVMIGDDDPIVRPINARLLAALLPKGQLHVVRGGGHLFMLLRAEQTAGTVAAFLKETETPLRARPAPRGRWPEG